MTYLTAGVQLMKRLWLKNYQGTLKWFWLTNDQVTLATLVAGQQKEDGQCGDASLKRWPSTKWSSPPSLSPTSLPLSPSSSSPTSSLPPWSSSSASSPLPPPWSLTLPPLLIYYHYIIIIMIINKPQQWAVGDLRHHRHPRRHGRGRCPGKKGFQVIIWWSFGSYGEYGDHIWRSLYIMSINVSR